jgi:hypothetical protein
MLRNRNPRHKGGASAPSGCSPRAAGEARRYEWRHQWRDCARGEYEGAPAATWLDLPSCFCRYRIVANSSSPARGVWRRLGPIIDGRSRQRIRRFFATFTAPVSCHQGP